MLILAVIFIISSVLMIGCGSSVDKKQADIPANEIVVTQDNETEQIFETTKEVLSEEDDKEIQEELVKIIMAGDILLHEKVSDSGKMDDGTYNYNHLFANLKDEISSADLALVNQEVILGGTEIGLSGYPNFNGAYEVGDALTEAGFDVILHATNHALDKGKNGLLNCISFWKTSYPNIGVVGIQQTKAEQDAVYVKEVNGIKIAILNYTYGTNGISLPTDMPFAVNLLEKEQVSEDVTKAKEVADFIVVCPHWGTEYTHGISNSQREWAEYFASLGVDLVLGTHPHVIEPIEWVEKEDGSRKTLVYYSIGNFINSTNETGAGVGDRMLGALAEITIKRDSNGQAVIDDYGVIPIVTHLKTGVGQITTVKLSEYTKELAMENEILSQDSGFSYQHCVDICKEVFGEVYEQ